METPHLGVVVSWVVVCGVGAQNVLAGLLGESCGEKPGRVLFPSVCRFLLFRLWPVSS